MRKRETETGRRGERQIRGISLSPLLSFSLSLALICPFAAVAQMALGPKPACPAGYKIVEEIVMKEQPRFCCEVVPKMKKKWVYDWVEDGFCIPHSPLHQHGCDKVPHCRSCTRKLLVKKEVEVCDGYKCESKKTMETVPCKVYRVVPRGPEGAEELPAPRPLPAADNAHRLDTASSPPPAGPLVDRSRVLPYFMLDRLPRTR